MLPSQSCFLCEPFPAGASDHASQRAGNQDSTSSWSTPFPPKVASTAVVATQKDFLKSYTSEILDQDTLPSPRLLALVKANVDNLKSKVGWRWVPWKFRLSQKAHDDKDSIALSPRPRKIAKLDLSDLLLDDIPLREIPSSGQLGNYQLSQILSLHSVAVALCKGCHLSTLRAYDRAFLELATKRYASDLNLRSPLASELEHADRMLWDQVSTLLSEDWKLDDALHQVTAVRSSLHVLLAARPCAPKAWGPRARTVPKGSGHGKGSSPQRGGRAKATKAPKAQTLCNVARSGQRPLTTRRFAFALIPALVVLTRIASTCTSAVWSTRAQTRFAEVSILLLIMVQPELEDPLVRVQVGFWSGLSLLHHLRCFLLKRLLSQLGRLFRTRTSRLPLRDLVIRAQNRARLCRSLR